VALYAFPKYWEPFVKGFCACEKLLDWQRTWYDCIHEETREESKGTKQESSDEHLAFVSKTRKGKGKGSNKKGNNDRGSSHLGKKKELSKIKCPSSHKNKHDAS